VAGEAVAEGDLTQRKDRTKIRDSRLLVAISVHERGCGEHEGAGVRIPASAWTSVATETNPLHRSQAHVRHGKPAHRPLGEVMKERRHAALSYGRTNAEKFDQPRLLGEERYSHSIPAGGMPKTDLFRCDALHGACVDAQQEFAFRTDVAMTEEITLRRTRSSIGD